MYRQILLTLDGSDLSRRAIPHAIALAKQSGGRLVLLEVIDSESQMIMQAAGATIEPIPIGQVTAEIAHEAVTAQREEAVARLEAAKRAAEAEGVQAVAIEIAQGSPGAAIVEAAERLGCDVVVIATHGRSGVKRAILGSVADHVVRHARHTSVLLVRATE